MPFGTAVGEGFNNGEILTVEEVIVTGGISSAVLVYSPSPGAGNLVGSWCGVVGGFTDKYGNKGVFGLGVYDEAGGFFTQYGGGFMTFGTGSLAAGWTANTTVENDSSGNLYLEANASIYANGVLIS